MSATAVSNPSPVSRKFRWLTAGIVLVAGIYSAGWFLAADQIEKRLTARLADGQAAGLGGECTNMDVRGFPFRIGLFCDKVHLDDTRHGTSASFGALRTAAQVYQPGHAVIELDGPAEIRALPGLNVSADWTLLHASVRATLSGVDRTSLLKVFREYLAANDMSADWDQVRAASTEALVNTLAVLAPHAPCGLGARRLGREGGDRASE